MRKLYRKRKLVFSLIILGITLAVLFPINRDAFEIVAIPTIYYSIFVLFWELRRRRKKKEWLMREIQDWIKPTMTDEEVLKTLDDLDKQYDSEH
jgi:hypothetical protein